MGNCIASLHKPPERPTQPFRGQAGAVGVFPAQEMTLRGIIKTETARHLGFGEEYSILWQRDITV